MIEKLEEKPSFTFLATSIEFSSKQLLRSEKTPTSLQKIHGKKSNYEGNSLALISCLI